MDKHYGWQEDRGAQNAGRFQNGQRWNERNRDDDRETRGSRGAEYGGWDQNEGRYGSREQRSGSSGADFDRGEYTDEGDSYGGSRGFGGGQSGQRFPPGHGGQSSQGEFGRNREFSTQPGNRPFRNEPFRGQGGSQGFSGGHYGGFANEGYSSQGGYGGRAAWNQGGFGNEGFSGGGNYGGNRGFSNYGYSGQGYGPRSSQSWAQDDRDFQRQGSWSQGYGPGSSPNYGQTFGQGYAGPGGTQGYAGQGYGPASYGRSSGQGFAGRGPKGYQRSDERIKEQVSDRLMDDDDIDATEITIEVKNGEVTLSGSVNSRQEKRAAEDAAEQTPGVCEVQNHLRVQSRESSSGRSASGQFGPTQSGSSGGRHDSFSKTQDSSSSQSKSKSTERE